MHAAFVVALLAVGCLSVVAVVTSRGRSSRRTPEWRRSARWRPSRRQRRLLEELDQTLASAPAPLPDPNWSLWPHRTAIEDIAADLRRLNGQRLGVARRSVMWRRAILAAYDDRLRMASHCLGVVECLDGLDGIDRHLERIRVEGELEAAGLNLRAATAYPHHRRP